MELLLKKYIRDVPDFPKPGIMFKDITPLLQEPAVFNKIIDNLVERYQPQKIDMIVGIESRGFIFGTPLAHQLRTGFVPVRKQGKLPYDTVSVSYALEYGTATMEMHVDAIKPGQRVLIVDDLLATGGTAEAACHLVEKQGGKVVECIFVVELAFLNGRRKIGPRPIHTLVKFD